jgi:hypothetical protein
MSPSSNGNLAHSPNPAGVRPWGRTGREATAIAVLSFEDYAVALVAEVSAAGALASLPAATLPSLRGAVGEALADAIGEESRALQLRLQQHADVAYADPHDALFARHALDLLIENRRAQHAIEDLQADHYPPRRIHAPIYRSRRAAVRNGLRAFLAVVISGVLLSVGGWPFASQAVAHVGATIALSANAPNPRAFAAGAVIATLIAVLLAGVTEFLILDGVDQFPLLAIGMAPSVLVAALLITSPNQRLASIAFLVLVFFLVILAPANPQGYNPETYLFSSLMLITAVILLFVLLRTVLPTSDAHLRRWYLTSARAEMRDLVAGRRSRASMMRPCSGTRTASGNWPRCSPPPTMSAVTTSVRLSTSSDARRLCGASGPRSPNCPLARAGAWLGKDIRPWPVVTPLACAGPPPISRAQEPNSIMMVRQQLARLAWI